MQLATVSKWANHVLDAFLAGAWFLFWTNDTLYWVSKPRVYSEPGQGRRILHRPDGPALESDIEPLYFWHGVLVPDFVVMRPETITREHILHESNAQIRQVMVERVGIERVCQLCQAQDVDAWGDYALLLLDLGDGRKRPYLKMKNPSVGVWHVEGVHPDCRTVRQALKWRNSLTDAEIDDVHGADWYQQGDVIIRPSNRQRFKSQPIVLT
jgi:hypothetical protein